MYFSDKVCLRFRKKIIYRYTSLNFEVLWILISVNFLQKNILLALKHIILPWDKCILILNFLSLFLIVNVFLFPQRLILNGSIKLTGVQRPVVPEIYTPILDEMADLGVRFHEETRPTLLWIR